MAFSFETPQVERNANLVDLEKSSPVRLLSLSEVLIQLRTSLPKFLGIWVGGVRNRSDKGHAFSIATRESSGSLLQGDSRIFVDP